MRVLVTGAAGFIGYHLSRALADAGHEVTGADNLSPYYDVSLKRARLAQLEPLESFSFRETDLADARATQSLFDETRPEIVLHLAAQPGVRYSLENPRAYTESNITGFVNILEGCRHGGVRHLVYASSSSVYGANRHMPFSEHDGADHPVSLYGATKRANELMAHTYSHLFSLPTTGLRFFTVYGPWGRPDMAPFLFTRSILEGREIDVFNHGQMLRDFTWVGDIVEGIARVMLLPPAKNDAWDAQSPDPATSNAPWRIYNIGNHTPVALLDFISILERALGVPARLNLLPMQPGDVLATFADVDDLAERTGFRPSTSLEEGLPRFVAWYRSYYGV